MARKSRAYGVEAEKEPDVKLVLAGVYKRLSVEDGDNSENNSIANQQKLAIHYLSEHSDIHLAEQYEDNGFTGMNYNRPGYRQMLCDLQSGRINCVIVKDISRLGRHFVMTSELVERIFPQLGVRLICINDNYDSADENADPTALTLPLKMVMNDYYVKDISQKIRSSITAKMDAGEFLPSRGSVPYGYLRNAEQVTFDIDSEPAAIVQEIYAKRLHGSNYNAIAKELNARGIPSPGRLRYLRGVSKRSQYAQTLWSHAAVAKILSDPVYTGVRIHGKVKRDRLGLPKTDRPQEEWQYIENAHDPIIPIELFRQVQEINRLEKERRSHFVKREAVEVDYRPLLKGKVFCADCGGMMSGVKRLGRPGTRPDIVYECRNYLQSQRTRCGIHYISQDTIMSEVKALLNHQVKTAVDVEQLCKDVRLMPKVHTFQSTSKQRLSGLSAKRKGIEGRLEQLLVDLAQRVITRDEYEYMRAQYERQRDELISQEAQAGERINALAAALSSTERWLQSVKRYHTLPEIDREVMDSLVEKVLVFADRHIKIVLRYADPYKPLSDFLQGVEENAG